MDTIRGGVDTQKLESLFSEVVGNLNQINLLVFFLLFTFWHGTGIYTFGCKRSQPKPPGGMSTTYFFFKYLMSLLMG